MTRISAARLPGLRRVPQIARRVEPDIVLFASWQGRHADSPRAIADELRRRDAPLRHVWVRSAGARDVEGAENVRPGSVACLQAFGRARYLVTNSSMPGYFRKKPATTYVQTWHGAPLKRIAFDIERPRFAGAGKYLDDLRRDVASWDYLVTPNSFSTPVFRRAFRFDGEVLETGYPRNDVLLSPERDAIRTRTRARLGIREDQTAVLYAPTWRDSAEFPAGLDLPGLAAQLGDGFAVLVRAHHLVTRPASFGDAPRLTDVSGRDDPAELYLAADVLITDYSSAMFDFAVTGKPILFFTYDLDAYRDDLRGFYFDFEREAPGPLLSDTREVTAALQDLAGVRDRARPAYERFRARFCHLDDGGASARVVEAVFSA